MHEERFTVETSLTAFAVTIRDAAVVRIELNARAGREAQSELERLVTAELRQYAAGDRTEFTFPIAPEGTAFDRRVWHAVSEIPYGETRTYGEIAWAIDKPKAARAVGTANGRNPVPPVIPCHRVVATGGKLGGYGGGLDLKRRLLNLETVARARSAFVVALCFAAMAAAATACSEPTRPEFAPRQAAPDTTPPTILIQEPSIEDSIYPPDTVIRVVAKISDPSHVQSVAASVVGAMFLEFPSFQPLDTGITATFLIPVAPTVDGRIQMVIVAMDTLLNRATVIRPFVIR